MILIKSSLIDFCQFYAINLNSIGNLQFQRYIQSIMKPATIVQNISIFLVTATFIYLTYRNPDFFIKFSSIVIGILLLFVAYFVARQYLLSVKYDKVSRSSTTKQSNVQNASAQNFSEKTKKYTAESLQKLYNSQQFKQFERRKLDKSQCMSQQQQKWENQNKQFLKDWQQNETKIFEQ